MLFSTEFFFFQYSFRSDGVYRLSEDVALPDFFHSLFSVCVCVCICGHVCVLSVQVSKCTFTHLYTHAYCQNWLGLFVTLPTMTTSSNVKNFFVFWFCFVLYMYIDFLYGFPQDVGTPEYFLCPATDWDFTHCQEVLLRMKGDLNKHKLNQWFVPDCFMFSIWHLSKLLFMWGTFIVRDCLCVWAIIFNVCHSQRDGTVLHMLCNQTQSWSGIV